MRRATGCWPTPGSAVRGKWRFQAAPGRSPAPTGTPAGGDHTCPGCEADPLRTVHVGVASQRDTPAAEGYEGHGLPGWAALVPTVPDRRPPVTSRPAERRHKYARCSRALHHVASEGFVALTKRRPAPTTTCRTTEHGPERSRRWQIGIGVEPGQDRHGPRRDRPRPAVHSGRPIHHQLRPSRHPGVGVARRARSGEGTGDIGEPEVAALGGAGRPVAGAGALTAILARSSSGDGVGRRPPRMAVRRSPRRAMALTLRPATPSRSASPAPPCGSCAARGALDPLARVAAVSMNRGRAMNSNREADRTYGGCRE